MWWPRALLAQCSRDHFSSSNHPLHGQSFLLWRTGSGLLSALPPAFTLSFRVNRFHFQDLFIQLLNFLRNALLVTCDPRDDGLSTAAAGLHHHQTQIIPLRTPPFKCSCLSVVVHEFCKICSSRGCVYVCARADTICTIKFVPPG